MNKFIKPSCEKIRYCGVDIKNWPINLYWVTAIEKTRDEDYYEIILFG